MDRRRFLQLVGLAGTLPVLGSACGGSTPGPTSPTRGIVSLGSPDRVLAAGVPQRIPFALVGSGSQPADGEVVGVRVLREGEVIADADVAAHLVEHDHVEGADAAHEHSDIQRYYPLRTTLPEPGVYDIEVAVGSATILMPVQAFARSEVQVPVPGDRFESIVTPTFEDPGGVDPLCSRFEPCPLHDSNAADLLAAGKPFALLVATPAYCSTAYCGPVVDTLVGALDAVDGVTGIHVEVYANPLVADGDYNDPRVKLAPAVQALGLSFEPSLFLVDAAGNLADRIDNVFDRNEAIAALTAVALQ